MANEAPLPRAVWSAVRKVLIAIAGTIVLLVGVLMMIGPGPGMIVLLAGLAILASEFVWAARLLRKVKDGARAAARRARGIVAPETKP